MFQSLTDAALVSLETIRTIVDKKGLVRVVFWRHFSGHMPGKHVVVFGDERVSLISASVFKQTTVFPDSTEGDVSVLILVG